MSAHIFSNAIEFAPINTSVRYPLALMVAMLQTAWQRRELRKLEAQRLVDMGIDLNDARIEASRPFWDLPKHQRERLNAIRAA